MERENLNKGIFFGLVGNLLFMVFALVCLIYYYTYDHSSIFSKILEISAYLVELSGFGLLAFADYLLIVSVRARKLMKAGFSIYIVMEALMMVLELNAAKLDFYAPYSLALAIIHSIVSGAALFGFLMLDPDNKRYEALIIASISIVLAGMLGNVMGIRVYFSIAMNAMGQAVLFYGIKSLMERQQMEIECIGDPFKAKASSGSTLFDAESYRQTAAQIAAESIRIKAEEAASDDEESEG